MITLDIMRALFKTSTPEAFLALAGNQRIKLMKTNSSFSKKTTQIAPPLLMI
jgi:hypothetical protein